jgi:hypothetical protein
VARRPCAFVTAASDLHTRPSADAHWLWPASAVHFEWSPSDTHPVCASGFAATSLRPSRALRRHVLATASPRRINRRTREALRARPATHDRLGLPQLRHARHDGRRTAPRHPRPSASLEVFVPCNARWPGSRCPGRPASGRSRFGVSPHPPARARSHANLPASVICISPLRFSARADSLR